MDAARHVWPHGACLDRSGVVPCVTSNAHRPAASTSTAGTIAAGLFAVSAGLAIAIPFAWCLVFGALISPTDPVAVLLVLRRAGISEALQAIIAGESLFNDGIG